MKDIVFSEEEIQGACKRIGAALTHRLKDDEKTPVFLGVMKGAMNFRMDLTKRVEIPINVDYIQLSSYSGTTTAGNVKVLKDFTTDIKGRSVVIVEDVIDSGYSMHYLIEHLKEHYQPKRVILCALFDKIVTRKVDVKIDYSGKILNSDKFLVGYGLDYNEFERNIPYVYNATPEDVKYWDSLIEKNNK